MNMKTSKVSGEFLCSVIFVCAMMMCVQNVSAKLDYTPLRGSSSFDGCDYAMLFDRNRDTKWCSAITHEGYDNGWWVIFKTSEAFCPTSYTITTGDDAITYPERNWKTWKIYGANFATDDSALKDASEWVLLDDKQNIGNDVIPNISFNRITFDMSESNTEAYEYFMIYVNECYSPQPDGSVLHQMADFLFVEPIESSGEIIFTALDGTKSAWGAGFAYSSLVDNDIYTKWCSATDHEGYDNGWWVVFKSSAPIIPYYYELTTGDDTGMYAWYERNWKAWKIYAANFTNDEEAQKNADGWVLIDEKTNIGTDRIPAASFATASFMLSQEVTEAYTYFKVEVSEILGGTCMQMSELKLREKATYTALDGTKSAWGAGFAYSSLVDNDISTKWCSATDHEGYDNGWWIVFKSSYPILPVNYEVTTGDDTGKYTWYERNWKAWKIYAANFASDEEATKGAEGWVLIDEKQDIGTDQIPAASFATAKFGLSEDVTEAYSYFKIEVTEILGGTCMQMSEFDFGLFADEFVEVSITSPGYATLFIPEKDVEIPEGVQAFAGKIDGARMILDEVVGAIPAGTAVVLKGVEGTYNFKYAVNAPAVGENDLKGASEAITAGGTQYVLALKDGVVGFYKAEVGSTIPAGKAYIEYTGAAGVKGFVLDDATGIEEIHNAQCIMHNNNAIFDLSGRRVEKGTKGVYIVNGKKVLY